jgi:hypothetical protein
MEEKKNMAFKNEKIKLEIVKKKRNEEEEIEERNKSNKTRLTKAKVANIGIKTKGRKDQKE